MKTYAAYYRVSTTAQGVSGLGLDAQRTSVRAFTGCPDGTCIAREFIEVESGRKNKRPVLAEALEFCKHNRHTLVISKLDRLSRNASFLFSLRDAGVDFVCVDMPEVTTLTLGVTATVAQWEAERISTRTKEALAARKAKGLHKTVVNNLTPERIKAGHAAISENARTSKEVVQVWPIIRAMRKEGATYRDIAAELNKRHFRTRTGKEFGPSQVIRIEQRFAPKPEQK